MNNLICAMLALVLAFVQALSPYTFSFPRDHGSHPGYRSEWWYFTGHLRAPDGHRFGYELTFFRLAIGEAARVRLRGRSAWHGTQLYPAHFAITDERSGRFVHYEVLAREALDQGGASQSGLNVHVRDWSLRGTSPFRLRAGNATDAITLVASSAKPVAIHGHGGVSRKGPCASCNSHYYSYTRLRTFGTLVASGRRYHVTGVSWMDHEFGSDELSKDEVGWDWFSVQLADGRELMLYRLRKRDGSTVPQSSGSLIEKNGAVQYIARDAFSIRSDATWTSPHTGARYPAAWEVRARGVPELRLKPAVSDQELVSAAGGVTYWEGSVLVRSTSGKVLGLGYVELTGYAGPVHF
ncbi:MAG: carotenoid 1,2-hydratase [Candidatus Eremiobacteraeota bacterium]|nr:carotenoid 1,2-hydratase [Candidatus Eremiobacteraeota bacterium]